MLASKSLASRRSRLIQDRDGALPLLKASRRAFPFIECAFADNAYAAERVSHATRIAIGRRSRFDPDARMNQR